MAIVEKAAADGLLIRGPGIKARFKDAESKPAAEPEAEAEADADANTEAQQRAVEEIGELI